MERYIARTTRAKDTTELGSSKHKQGAATAPGSKTRTHRTEQHADGDMDMPLNHQLKPAGTPSTRSTRQHCNGAAQQQTPGRHKSKQQGADQHKQQKEQPDVIMIDGSDSGNETFDTAASSEQDSDEEREAAQQARRPRQRRTTAPAAAAESREEIVIPDSEEEEQASDSDSEAAGQAAAAAAEGKDDSSDDEGGSHSEDEPFHSTRASKKSSRAAAAAKPAPKPSSYSTPKKQAGAAAAAAVTPKRNAAAAVTPRSTRAGTGTAAAATATPSGRPVRSCTKAKPAAAEPSLATPMGKLSLSHKKPAAAAAHAAPASVGKRLRSSSTSSKPGQRQHKGGKGSSSSSGPLVGDVLPRVEVDGEVFMRGDDVYLRLDEYEHEEEDEEEACEVCSSSSSRRGNAILECSTCLCGFHLRCLTPPLKKVPEGDWLCPDCNAGRAPPPPARLVTKWQKLLHGRDQLALVHVLGCQRGKAPNGTEEDQMLVRYYILPQNTHLGRQRHHGARELFLGTETFVEPACAVTGRAYVHPPSRFAEVHEEEGNDVFLCEFEYDESWKRFRTRRYGQSDPLGDSAGGGGVCPLTPSRPDRLATGLSAAWDAQRGGLGDEFEFDESGRAGWDSSDGGSDSADSDDDDGADGNYRPDFGQHLRGVRGPVKRKRHGQLPAAALAAAAAADRFAGLGAADIGSARTEQRDAFGLLHTALSLASVPASLPCREDERTRLEGFVNRALHEDGGILYICGVPGTGKTALVMEVLSSLKEAAVAAGGQFMAINCLQLPSPQHVFSRLWEKLSGQHLGPARARDALTQLFGVSSAAGGSRRRYSTIIVLDEIDMLMTRDQAVLYQLFDWPNQPGSRLGVIGISNTHDLDQRVLPRIASRLDQAKLAFAPYGVNQLLTIVQGRLDASGVAGAVEEAAVQLACRKVAAETGDVRRALEMLRRAVEIARQHHVATAAPGGGSSRQQQQQPVVVEWQEGSAALVGRQHVRQAQNEMFSALHHQLLRSRSQWEKVLLVAVVVEARATGRNAVVIQSVCERATNSICSLVDLAAPPLGVLQQCLVKLAGVRLLLSDGCHIKAHVALNVDKDDVALAVREDERLQRLHQLM